MRVLGISFQFLSQPIDMRVDVPLIAFVLSAPDTIEQVVARPGAAGLRRQQLQDLKLKWSQINPGATACDFVTPLIYHQVANLHSIFVAAVLAGRLTTAQQGLDPVLELTP